MFRRLGAKKIRSSVKTLRFPKNSQKKDAFIPSRRCVFFGGHQTHQNHKKSPDSPAHVAFQLSCLKLFLQSHRLVGREAKVWPDSLFLGALQKAATLDIQQVTMCIYVKIRVFIYIHLFTYIIIWLSSSIHESSCSCSPWRAHHCCSSPWWGC